MDKLFNFVKTHKVKIVIFLIIVAGILLRLISIDKQGGMWFDEMYCYYIASQENILKILDKLYNEDFHAPLYFIILHYWMKFFGDSDLILRLFSLLCSVATIPVFYKIGKKINSENFGLICAAIAALNSILIYYSQEVKFYSMLFLLSSILMLYLLKYKEEQSKLNSTVIGITSITILYTYTLGLAYLAFLGVMLSIYFFRTNKDIFKHFLKLQLVVAIVYLPYLFMVLHHSILLNNFYLSLVDVFPFSLANILTTVQMMFSPVVLNLSNGVPVALGPEYILTIHFFSFAVIPTFICLYGLFRSLKTNDFKTFILTINLAFIILAFILTLLRQFIFIPRYILIAFPAILIFAMYGLYTIPNKKSAKILITLYIAINFIYLSLAPYSAPRLDRLEKYGSAANMLKNEKITKQDLVCMPFSGNLLTKYADVNVVDIDFGKIYLRNTDNSLEMIFDKNLTKKLNKKNAPEELKTYVYSTQIPKKFEKYLDTHISKKLKRGSKFVIVVNSTYYIPNIIIQQYKNQDDKLHKRFAMFYILYSKMVNHIVNYAFENFKMIKIIKSEDDIWVLYLFEKK